jgi:hypothetical protein
VTRGRHTSIMAGPRTGERGRDSLRPTHPYTNASAKATPMMLKNASSCVSILTYSPTSRRSAKTTAVVDKGRRGEHQPTWGKAGRIKGRLRLISWFADD